MSEGIPVRATAIWALLLLATGVTWWLGTDHRANAGGHVLVAMAIPVAFSKVYLIGMEFMEVRTAPRTLRVVFASWVVSFATALTLLYL